MVHNNLAFLFNNKKYYFNKNFDFKYDNKKTHPLINNSNKIDIFFNRKNNFILVNQNIKTWGIWFSLSYKYYSQSKIFKNLEWYERELNEMSPIKIYNLYDSRSLLLMYSLFLNKHERFYNEDKGQHPYFSLKKKNIIFQKRNYIIL